MAARRSKLEHLLLKRVATEGHPYSCALKDLTSEATCKDQWEPGQDFYNLPYAISISGRLNVPALERSMKEILREPSSNIDGHSISTDR